jgi:hypothetical protein
MEDKVMKIDPHKILEGIDERVTQRIAILDGPDQLDRDILYGHRVAAAALQYREAVLQDNRHHFALEDHLDKALGLTLTLDEEYKDLLRSLMPKFQPTEELVILFQIPRRLQYDRLLEDYPDYERQRMETRHKVANFKLTPEALDEVNNCIQDYHSQHPYEMEVESQDIWRLVLKEGETVDCEDFAISVGFTLASRGIIPAECIGMAICSIGREMHATGLIYADPIHVFDVNLDSLVPWYEFEAVTNWFECLLRDKWHLMHKRLIKKTS